MEENKLRLRSLEIQGFKSFPDKTKLQFGDGITAVVGPNGSGKSNIADAVRWVLGEQSTKNLRGQRMEDVIFGGTQTRKAQGFAQVQLTIDNADRALGFDDDEVIISRKLYRSGESEYRLGNTLVRLKDIHELLMDTGLGRDGYSIIGQGRIAEIVSAKSTQRREIFEEAAGIAKYRYRKEEAEKKLNQAEENLLRLRDILAELEGRVSPLKDQADKAKSFLALSGEKRSLEISLWLMGLERLKGQMAGQEDNIFRCKSQYEQMERESAGIEEKIGTHYRQSQEMGAQTESHRAQIKSLEERLSKGEAERAVLQNDVRHNELSVQRLLQELESAGTGVEHLAGQIGQKQRELEESAGVLAAMAGKIEAGEQRLAEQKEQASRVVEEIAGLNARFASLTGAMGDARTERAASETLRTENTQRLQALRQSSGGQASAVMQLQQSIKECEAQQQERQKDIDSLSNSLRGYQLKRDSRAEKLEGVQKQRQELENQAAQKQQRAKLLEDLEASMEGFAHSVKYILGESKKGALGGVYGPVSSLIRVPERYALAIETALGGALQNVVVENEDVAKRAIRMLQGAKAGRATFLPVSAVKGRTLDAGNAIGDRGYVGVAAELVQCDKPFAGVLSYLLGRVCIVEDLDAGTRIAKAAGYSFRIVTLDGQVINAGGSYTGGSTGKQTGLLSRRGEIEALTAQAKDLRDKARAVEQDSRTLAQELSALDASLSGVLAERQTAQEELVRLGYARESLEKELSQARTNQALAEKELETLASRLEELEGTELTSARMIEELEAQIAALAESLDAATARRDALTEGTENISASLADQRMTHLSAHKDHELLGQEIVRMREQMENAGARGEQVKNEITGLEQQCAIIQSQIEALAAERLHLNEEIERYTQSIKELLEQRTNLEAATTELRAQEREVSGRREVISRELARLEERRSSLQTDYDAIIAKLWDEYELTRSQAKGETVEIEDHEKAQRKLSDLRAKIRALGTVNVAAIEEYAQVSERYEFLSGQVADVENARGQLRQLILDLTGEMRELFSQNFQKIAEQFSKIFIQLFGGGKAELTLTQEEDVLEAGVDIFVQPPGKIIKNLSLLSGGEQAFVAIAIYFAILKVKPAPFVLLDEIEAALDDVNVTRFAGYLRLMTRKTQFIAITHRRGTMEEADVLYGVTMQDEGISKLLELHVSEIEEKLGSGVS